MPRVSEFFGIVISLFYNDHAPPHFHAEYAGEEAAFEIATLEMFQGHLRGRARALVMEWASQHRAELMADWELARRGVSPLNRIPPLD